VNTYRIILYCTRLEEVDKQIQKKGHQKLLTTNDCTNTNLCLFLFRLNALMQQHQHILVIAVACKPTSERDLK
jgi:hypothetical protein